MLVLVLTVCTLAAPEQCREVRLPVAEDMTPARCSLQAMPRLAEWVGEHPSMRVASWRCAPVKSREA